MQQKSLKVQSASRRISPTQTVIKLEAEIRRNQWRIERLHDKNHLISQRITQIEQQHHQLIASDSASGNPRESRSRKLPLKRPQLSKTWLSIGVLSLCLIVSCGVIGFAVARLVSPK